MFHKKYICWVVFGGVLAALFVFWARMSPQKQGGCFAKRTLSFYYDPIMDAATGSLFQAECAECQDLMADAVFHMHSAVNFINRESSRKGLVGRFMSAHPEWNDGDSVEDAFRGLKVELKGGLPPSARIWVYGDSSELAQMVADFYAAEVAAYFRNENDGLNEKMSAWFETQKVGKNKDEIDKIEGQKRVAFRNAMRKSMRVVSADWLQGAKAK